MANPRVPKAKAAVSGQADKNPQRFRERKEPKSPRLGKPSSWMTPKQAATWEQFARELPWLNESHRALLEIAVTIRCRLVDQTPGNEVGIQALNLLRQCLGQMGATPSDASKVTVPDDGAEDPDEKFFSRPN